MGWTDGEVLWQGSGWQLLCNYKSGMRFEGCKILSAGALVQEHVSSRSGSAPGEERGEELSCDQQCCSFFRRFMFWYHFDRWDFTSPIFLYHLFICFILRVIMKTKCLWSGTENFLLILQLLAICLYWECQEAYPPGPSLREGSIYTLVSYVGQLWHHWKFTWSSAKHLSPPFKHPH